MLDFALAPLADGLAVHPVVYGGKTPFLKDWPSEAAKTPEQVAEYWESHPEANIGAVTNGFLVLDIDVKKGDGEAALRALENEHGPLPVTRTHSTPSGGRHLLFKPSRPVGNKRVGPHLDIRGENGFILWPGSTVGGKPYEVLNAAPIAPAPKWLEDLCSHPNTKPKSKVTAPSLPIDQDRARSRAVDYLEGLETITQGERNQSGYAVACRLKDFGVSEFDMPGLLLEHWKCEPMLSTGELEHVVRSAYQYGKDAPGILAPEAVFDKVAPDTKEPGPKKSRRLQYTLLGDLKAKKYPVPLVRGLIDQGSIGIAYGPTGVGKTFVTLDLAGCVARGVPFLGHATKQGGALYVAAEGGAGPERRLMAYRKHHGLAAAPLAIVSASVDLSKPADVQDIIAMAGDLELETGQPTRLICVDTLSASMGRGTDSDDEVMRAYYQSLKRIRDATGSAVIAVHHTGKDKNAGPRGSSVIRADYDFRLLVDERTITNEKTREDAVGGAVGFDLLPIPIGFDEDGVEVTSCVVVPRRITKEEKKLSDNEQLAMTALEDLTLNNPNTNRTDWKNKFAKSYKGTPKACSTAFDRASRALVEYGRVIEFEGKYAPR